MKWPWRERVGCSTSWVRDMVRPTKLHKCNILKSHQMSILGDGKPFSPVEMDGTSAARAQWPIGETLSRRPLLRGICPPRGQALEYIRPQCRSLTTRRSSRRACTIRCLCSCTPTSGLFSSSGQPSFPSTCPPSDTRNTFNLQNGLLSGSAASLPSRH